MHKGYQPYVGALIPEASTTYQNHFKNLWLGCQDCDDNMHTQVADAGLQLSGTFATRYYLNPNIPETLQIRQMHTQVIDAAPILDIQSQRHEDQEQEKTQNRFLLAVLLEVVS
ncbi:hypothetical protein Tco_0518218 [Tanacetum coccineum]